MRTSAGEARTGGFEEPKRGELEYLELFRSVEPGAHSQRLREELRMAGEFQRAVLPGFPELDYLRGDLRYLPYDTISGDVYDFVQSREREVGVFVGDATGHGVIAAFMTMMVHLGLDSLRPDLPTNEAMRRLNSLLAARNTGRWISAVYFRIKPDGELSVTHAGHPSLLVLPKRGGTPVSFDEGGCALGMFAEEAVPYAEESYRLFPGDKLIVYTDGLVEWNDRHGEAFGAERLVRALLESRGESVAGLMQRVFARIKDFANGMRQRDDVTMMCLEYCP